MELKYRIFYDCHYRRNTLDFTEDILASSDEEAIRIAEQFIEKKNRERAEETRQEMLPRMPKAAQFTEEQLLHSNRFVLTGVSIVTETSKMVEVKKEELQSIYVPGICRP